MDSITWNEMYKLAKQYYDDNGNLLVSINYITENNANLGSWIHYQRRRYKSGSLSKTRMDLLEKIGMIWDPFASRWDEIYEEAEKYYIENGNLLVPYNYISDKGTLLGAWIRNQRERYKKNSLSIERINLLEQLGMSWNTIDSKWNDKYELAVQFFKENGDSLIPSNYLTSKGVQLGAWINTQRGLYKANKLSKEKIELLDLIEMEWEPIESRWKEFYKLAEEYYKANGNLLVSVNYVTKDGMNLGSWISNQRANFKTQKLSYEKVELLGKIGMVWEPVELQWYKCYELAEKYYNENGDLLIPRDYATADGCKLGNWISVQRKKNKDRSLEQEKTRLLNKIGMVWNTCELRWQECYNLLVDFYNTNGNVLVPLRYVSKNDIKLGHWLSRQRTNYKEKKLSQERIELLEKVGMVWDPAEATWDMTYQIAKQYYVENKNLSITGTCIYRGVNLGSWLVTQRKNYLEGRLSDRQIDLLDKIGMEWVYSNNPDYVWEKNYNTVLDFYTKYKHLYIPISYVSEDGVKLGVWLHDRKIEYERNELSEERKRKLDKLDKSWLKSINTKSSFPEQAVLFYIRKVFPNATKLITNEISEIDIYIPDLKVGIEYDGPSHRGREIADTRKSEKCSELGIELIRVRDCSLPILNDNSNKIVLSDNSFDALDDAIVKLLAFLHKDKDSISVNVKRDYIEIADNYIQSIDIDWYFMYERLKEYHEEHGDINVPISYKTRDGVLLGHWLSNIRSSYKAPDLQNIRLNSNKIKLLEELGIDWTPIETQWKNLYSLAEQYYKEKGDLLIPNKYVTSNNIKLGRWIGTQRNSYKENTLSKEKIALLEKIGMIWFVHDYEWKNMYELATRYYNEKGNLLVPSNYKTSDGVSLGSWIGAQRKYYREDLLSCKQIELLDKIGMVWSIDDYEWMKMYELAVHFYTRNGNLLVPKDYKTKGNDYLGAWVVRQRNLFQKSELSSERIELLNRINMEWTKIDLKWMEKYKLAVAYYNSNGNLEVPMKYTTDDGINLGIWIKHQRKRYRENIITPKEMSLLNQIGMIWNLHGKK